MFIIFFDAQGMIHHEFVPERQTVNGKFYLDVMEWLLKRIHRVHPEFHNSKEWFLLHDNAPAHTTGVVARFLARIQVTVLCHPSYSPDSQTEITNDWEAFSGHFNNTSKCDRGNQEHSKRLI
jgi:hypothetical protein